MANQIVEPEGLNEELPFEKRSQDYARQLRQQKKDAKEQIDPTKGSNQEFQKMNPHRGEYVPKAVYTGPPVPKTVNEMPEFEKKEMADSSFLDKYNKRGAESSATQQDLDPTKSARALATGGQIAGRTTQAAAKGVEIAAKGTEAVSRGVRRGGQSLTRAGAELSSTGVGAIAGVPMMIAGGAMAAGGAVGEGLSKGAQKSAQGANKFGARVAEGSKEMKQGLKGASALEELGNESPTNILKREFAKTKKAAKDAIEGNVTKAVGDLGGEAVSFALARALSLAWEFLIPTFGLSLIWINIHFVARYIFHSDKFCAFGDEWSITRSKTSKLIPGLEIVEIMGLIVLDLLAFVIILVVTGVFAGLISSITGGGASGGAGASGGF